MREKGFLEIEASFRKDKNILLEVLIDENMGDEDDFGVEPDDYLVGIVAPDGTFAEPLHVPSTPTNRFKSAKVQRLLPFVFFAH